MTVFLALNPILPDMNFSSVMGQKLFSFHMQIASVKVCLLNVSIYDFFMIQLLKHYEIVFSV